MVNLNQHFYINLDRRKDRNGECISELRKLGIKKPNRFSAIEHENGMIGCALSHIAVLNKAKELNWDYCIVFEDDIVIEGKKALLNKIQKYINYDFDVLYLGCWVRDFPKIIADDLIQIGKAQTTHAYIIKKHYYDILIKNLEDGIKEKNIKDTEDNNIDNYIGILQKKDKWLCLKPIHVSQRDGYSDNFKKVRNLKNIIKQIPY
jgi:hypothetical protein